MKHYLIFFLLLTLPSLTYASTTYKALEEQSMDKVNAIRLQHGLKPLKHSISLCNSAQEHSQNMALAKIPLGHHGFQERAEKHQKSENLCAFGENVAYNWRYDDPVQAAIDGWMKSPGHKANILGDYNLTGFGIWVSLEGKYYFTQLFAKKL